MSKHRERRGFRAVARTWLRIGVPAALASGVLLLAWILRPGLVTGLPHSPLALVMVGVGLLALLALLAIRVLTGADRATWWAQAVPPVVALALVLVPLAAGAAGTREGATPEWSAAGPAKDRPTQTTDAGGLEPAASQSTAGQFTGVVGRHASGTVRLVRVDGKPRLELRQLRYDAPRGTKVDVLLLPGAGGQRLHRVRLGEARSDVPVQTYPLPDKLRLPGPTTILLWQPDPGRPIATAYLATR